jgi:hypothetical protein
MSVTQRLDKAPIDRPTIAISRTIALEVAAPSSMQLHEVISGARFGRRIERNFGQVFQVAVIDFGMSSKLLDPDDPVHASLPSINVSP